MAEAGQQKIEFSLLKEVINKSMDAVMKKLKTLKGKDDIGIDEMFEMQLLMNHLSQLSEMSTNVVAASNQAITMAIRNVK